MIGLDTETHLGKAVLIATPRKHLAFPKTFEHILDFLLSTEDTRFVCWNADYDCSAILKFLKPGVLERVYLMDSWTYKAKLPSGGNARRITLKYIPRKYLKVTIGKKTIEIYDLAQFYHMTLDKASETEFGEHKSDVGVDWDKLQHTLASGGKGAQKIIDYCRRDAELVERLYEKTQEKFATIGVTFDRPISCASLSYQVFKEQLTARKISRAPNYLARMAFRGGRIECLKVGYFPKAYYIDLRSAYPSEIRHLDAVPRYWEDIPVDGEPEDFALYAAVDCVIRTPFTGGEYAMPFPWSRMGLMLLFPVGRWRQMLTLTEYRHARKMGMIERVMGGVQGIGAPGIYPYKERVEELYAERFKDKQRKWAVKILLNSLYGKMAETKLKKTPIDPNEALRVLDDRQLRLHFVGEEMYRPHTNFFTAGEVTARVRMRLYNELDARYVIFYATDGVFLTEKPTGLDFGDALGQWSPTEEVRDLVVVGSGVYSYRYQTESGSWSETTKFRGFNSKLDLNGLLDTKKHIIPIELTRNQKLGQTVVNQNWPNFNVIGTDTRNLDVNFDKKRVWPAQWTGRDLLTRHYDSMPRWVEDADGENVCDDPNKREEFYEHMQRLIP